MTDEDYKELEARKDDIIWTIGVFSIITMIMFCIGRSCLLLNIKSTCRNLSKTWNVMVNKKQPRRLHKKLQMGALKAGAANAMANLEPMELPEGEAGNEKGLLQLMNKNIELVREEQKQEL